MPPPKIPNKLYLFLFYGLTAACTAETGPSATVYPEAGTPDEILFNGRCHECHKPPLPRDRNADAWPMIVERMQTHRIANGLEPLTHEEEQRIKAYLQRNAKRLS